MAGARGGGERGSSATAAPARSTCRTAATSGLGEQADVAGASRCGNRSAQREGIGAGGFTLADLLVALAAMAIVAAIGLPELARASAQMRLELGAIEIASTLRHARVYALRHGAKVGLKFRTASDGRVWFALFRDGDGDGVRNDDLARGTDPRVEPWRPLAHLGRGTGFGFPPGPLPRAPGGGPIGGSRDDPVRFNRSDLASFSPVGTATPGSVYLTDGRGGLALVRVTSLSGRVRTMRWDARAGAWRQF